MIEDTKSSQSEVKASKSDKRLRSYGHLKICIVSHQFWVNVDVFDMKNKRRRRLLVAAQPPTLEIFDIPVNVSHNATGKVHMPNLRFTSRNSRHTSPEISLK